VPYHPSVIVRSSFGDGWVKNIDILFGCSEFWLCFGRERIKLPSPVSGFRCPVSVSSPCPMLCAPCFITLPPIHPSLFSFFPSLFLPRARCSSPFALCSVLCALCSVLHAPCPLPHALCCSKKFEGLKICYSGSE